MHIPNCMYSSPGYVTDRSCSWIWTGAQRYYDLHTLLSMWMKRETKIQKESVSGCCKQSKKPKDCVIRADVSNSSGLTGWNIRLLGSSLVSWTYQQLITAHVKTFVNPFIILLLLCVSFLVCLFLIQHPPNSKYSKIKSRTELLKGLRRKYLLLTCLHITFFSITDPLFLKSI